MPFECCGPKPTIALDDEEKRPELTQLRNSHEGAVDEIFRSVHWLIHNSTKYIFLQVGSYTLADLPFYHSYKLIFSEGGGFQVGLLQE